MPSLDELRLLMGRGFKETPGDFSTYISVLSALQVSRGQSLIDYGCSWGYGSWQLAEAGYAVTAFEISAPRCEYAAERLEMNAHSDINRIKGPFDVFFSSHVLEHVPSVSESISLARRLVRPGGMFVAFTPNGSEAFRRVNPTAWNNRWGRVHPNYLDDVFYAHTFRGSSCLIASSPYDLSAIEKWGPGSSTIMGLEGDELLVAVRF